MLFRPAKSVAILGGGVSGLVAAWRLTKLGHDVRLYEQTGRLGGAVRTEMTGGWLVEAGPNTFQEDSLRLRSLLSELKIDRERLYAEPATRRRYLVRRGRLVPVPSSPAGFLLSPLLSPGARLRALADLLRWRGYARNREDCSLADLVRAHFGPQFLERVAQPVVSGLCAGDPAKLSARHAFARLWEADVRHGSVLRGLRQAEAGPFSDRLTPPRTASFQRGLQTLYHALVLQLPAGTIATNARVEVLKRGEAGWHVLWRELRNPSGSHTADGPAADELQTEPFDVVLSTLPPAALARLDFAPGRDRPLAGLAAIEYAPLSTLFLGFRREQVAHPLDGFGVLVPAAERRRMLGAIFSSSLFPGRAPAGHVALTVMAGGALQPETARLPTAELIPALRPDLEQLLGVKGEPAFVRHHFWPQAIPQYPVGHSRHLEAIAACEKKYPAFLVGGQPVDGISLNAAIGAGDRLAQRVIQSDYHKPPSER